MTVRPCHGRTPCAQVLAGGCCVSGLRPMRAPLAAVAAAAAGPRPCGLTPLLRQPAKAGLALLQAQRGEAQLMMMAPPPRRLNCPCW